MRMYFEVSFGKRGVIGYMSCEDRQTYDVTLENSHKVIRKDLGKVMSLMEKTSSVYLRVGYGEDAYSEKQVLCINQTYADRENDVYNVCKYLDGNTSDEYKAGAGKVKRIVLDLYDGIKRNSEILAEEEKLKADAEANAEVQDQQETGTEEANAIANDFDNDEDVAGDGTPLNEVMQEIIEDEKKTVAEKTTKRGGKKK